MSETPRTNEKVDELMGNSPIVKAMGLCALALDLERELNAANALLEVANARIAELEKEKATLIKDIELLERE